MPDQYHNVTLYYLGFVPGAQSLLVSTTMPVLHFDKTYWLPIKFLAPRQGDLIMPPEEHKKGQQLDFSVSGWWLKREGLTHLVEREGGAGGESGRQEAAA